MIKNFTLILLLCIALVNCKEEQHQALENPETEKVEDTFVKDNYTKKLDTKKLQFTLSKFLTSIGLSPSNLD